MSYLRWCLGVSTMITHLFGDAYSPFFVGLVSDLTYGNSTYYNQFKGLQLGILTCPIVCVLGAAAFFACACFYDADKKATDDFVEENARRLKEESTSVTRDNDSSLRRRLHSPADDDDDRMLLVET